MSEETEIFYRIVKASSRQVVKQGSAKMELPDDLSRFLADQLGYTLDLLKKGNKLTVGSLSILLAQKSLSIGQLATGKRFECALTSLVLLTSAAKAAFFTTLTGPAHLAWTAAELVAGCNTVDKACGISDAVVKEVEKVSLPAFMWLDHSITSWMSRGGG